MRLLNVKTKQLEEYFGEEIPDYAILSHTWGKNEVTFKDIELKGYESGSVKIDGCLRQASEDGYSYVWIDTCCIDKSSSAELSEAINSMWTWYQQSKVCYAYLVDVSAGEDLAALGSSFRDSRWFTRGWTLQELLAPRVVRFYSHDWKFLGRLDDHLDGQLDSDWESEDSQDDDALDSVISEITGIRPDYFGNGERIQATSIAVKMSWAAKRTASRI